ncbi:hypothetical protein BDR06DRAFT_972775 [Suillus hirtellus]|nr:hypothetical protein BDR06DRAFT_972775 [Suillus hirtellus]
MHQQSQMDKDRTWYGGSEKLEKASELDGQPSDDSDKRMGLSEDWSVLRNIKHDYHQMRVQRQPECYSAISEHVLSITGPTIVLAVPESCSKSRNVDVQPEEDFNMPSIDDEFFADEPKDASDFKLSGNETDAGTDADLEPIEDKSDNCIVKSLSAELLQTVKPFPFSSAQPNLRAPTRTPIWADDSPSEEDHHGGLTSDEHCNSLKGNLVECNTVVGGFGLRGISQGSCLVFEPWPLSNAQADHIHNYDHTTGGPKLVWTDTRKIKLIDQDLDTCRVVQRAILEAKVHLTFVNGYLELTEKVSLPSRISSTLMTHIVWLSQLCPDCVNAAKKLLVNHVYHYTQHFDDKNVAIPQANKSYSADILPYLMKGCYFNGPKLVGVKFLDHFKEIMSNKVQQPKAYAVLFWKSNGSTSKFNFTGNLFSKVYLFYVKFLEKLRWDAPGKFHRLMADIFKAICSLCLDSLI